jgi:hypothetical protein
MPEMSSFFSAFQGIASFGLKAYHILSAAESLSKNPIVNQYASESHIKPKLSLKMASHQSSKHKN